MYSTWPLNLKLPAGTVVSMFVLIYSSKAVTIVRVC